MKEGRSLQDTQIGAALLPGNLLAQRPDPPQMSKVMRAILRALPDPQHLSLISGLGAHFFCRCT
jgi:hypothetical protein